MIKPTLKLFDRATQGELIRFTEGGQTHWTLVGDRGRGRLMLLVLPLNSSPYCENILSEMDEMDVLRPPMRGHPCCLMERTIRSASIMPETAMWVEAALLCGHLVRT